MKKFAYIAIGVLTMQSALAVTLPFVDHIAYSDGQLFTVGAGVWNAGGSAGPEITVAAANALTSPSGFATASDKGVLVSSSGTARRNVLQFTAASNGEIYASFLVNVSSVSGSDRLLAYFENTTSSTTTPELGVFLNSGLIGIGRNTSTPGFSASLSAGTHLIVIRYTFTGTQAHIWVDPSSSDYGAVTAPIPTGATSGSGAGTGTLQYFAINSPSGASAINAKVDEVRIGTTWASVTPSSGPPPPVSTNVVITAISILPGGDVALTGTGGTANASYEVETSTDMTIPLTNWLPVAIHQFDSLGNFTCTNPVTPSETARFFAIHVGGTNSIPPSPPIIVSQPQDKTNSAGTTANFSVGVSGTPPFRYQWYFNSITPLAGKTNSTLTLLNVQTGDSGGYSALVSNTVGSVTSVVAQLLVTNVFSAPSIITHPQSQSVTVSNNASFSVVATGTQPLFYQWYYNTNSLIVDATNSTLMLNNVQFGDAGDYDVTVSNSLGTANSNFATLTVNAPSTNVNFNHIGYASYGVALTGGSGGPTVDVYQLSDMAGYYGTDDNPLPNSNPIVFRINGTVTLRTNGDTYFGNNKTFLGIGTNAVMIGDIGLYGCSNIIIRNVEMRNPSGYGEDDAITMKNGAKHIWIDHCTFRDTLDGMVDATVGCDFITVSWCKFYYTAPTGHEDVNLIGGNDGDTGDNGKLHVTFHHNWWGALTRERMISVRYGRGHVFNNYYNIGGNNYCNRTRINAEMLVEGNWFENVQNPWELLTTSGTTGKLLAQNNNVNYLDTTYGVTWVNGWYPGSSLIPGTGPLNAASWNPSSLVDPDPSNVPPYAYTLDNAADVPNIVINNCGAGKGPFAP